MDVEECLKEWEDLVADYKRLEVNLLGILNIILSSVFMEFKCVVHVIFNLQPVDSQRYC